MEYVDANGASIPALGLGTWQNTGPQCADTVETALDLGYRHVDTAQGYDNEADVGAGLERATVDRDEVFLTTKVWRANLRPDDVRASVEASLDRLDVDHVDLLLIHWPHPRVSTADALRAMAECRDDGLVRHLGVSNFTADQLESALAAVDAPIVADQVLYHPYKDQSDLLEVCRERDVALTAYSPLARGRVLGDATLDRIGERYDKSGAQVALRWFLQQEGVIAIPKSTNPDHLAANLAVFDFELSDEEMTTIEALSPGLRTWLYNLSPRVMRRVPF